MTQMRSSTDGKPDIQKNLGGKDNRMMQVTRPKSQESKTAIDRQFLPQQRNEALEKIEESIFNESNS